MGSTPKIDLYYFQDHPFGESFPKFSLLWLGDQPKIVRKFPMVRPTHHPNQARPQKNSPLESPACLRFAAAFRELVRWKAASRTSPNTTTTTIPAQVPEHWNAAPDRPSVCACAKTLEPVFRKLSANLSTNRQLSGTRHPQATPTLSVSRELHEVVLQKYVSCFLFTWLLHK